MHMGYICKWGTVLNTVSRSSGKWRPFCHGLNISIDRVAVYTSCSMTDIGTVSVPVHPSFNVDVFYKLPMWTSTLQSSHNDIDGVSNHQRFDCLLNCLFRSRSKKISKLRATGFCEGNHRWAKMFPLDDVIMSVRCDCVGHRAPSY